MTNQMPCWVYKRPVFGEIKQESLGLSNRQHLAAFFSWGRNVGTRYQTGDKSMGTRTNGKVTEYYAPPSGSMVIHQHTESAVALFGTGVRGMRNHRHCMKVLPPRYHPKGGLRYGVAGPSYDPSDRSMTKEEQSQ